MVQSVALPAWLLSLPSLCCSARRIRKYKDDVPSATYQAALEPVREATRSSEVASNGLGACLCPGAG